VIIDTNGESVNLPILLRTLLRGGRSMLDYTVEYLRHVQPRLVVTMIDTTVGFYRLKSRLPDVTTIAIQNGNRGYETFAELAEHSHLGLTADRILCFGEADRDIYGPHIDAAITPVGSLRNNSVPLRPHPMSRTVALISTLRSKVDLDARVPGYHGPNDVTYREIFRRRLELAEYLADFCEQESLELVVVGKDLRSRAEATWYERALGPEGSRWRFAVRSGPLSSYEEIDRARIVVTSSSTLGYEALARGIRAAFFMIDAEVTSNFGDRFAWPLEIGDRGPIWANFLERETTWEILTRLHHMSDTEWNSLRRDYVPRVIDFDPDNSRARAILGASL